MKDSRSMHGKTIAVFFLALLFAAIVIAYFWNRSCVSTDGNSIVLSSPSNDYLSGEIITLAITMHNREKSAIDIKIPAFFGSEIDSPLHLLVNNKERNLVSDMGFGNIPAVETRVSIPPGNSFDIILKGLYFQVGINEIALKFQGMTSNLLKITVREPLGDEIKKIHDDQNSFRGMLGDENKREIDRLDYLVSQSKPTNMEYIAQAIRTGSPQKQRQMIFDIGRNSQLNGGYNQTMLPFLLEFGGKEDLDPIVKQTLAQVLAISQGSKDEGWKDRAVVLLRKYAHEYDDMLVAHSINTLFFLNPSVGMQEIIWTIENKRISQALKSLLIGILVRMDAKSPLRSEIDEMIEKLRLIRPER